MRGEPLRCPNDGTRLVELERADVLIDACPSCRAVWLDRGELDKILVKERQLSGRPEARGDERRHDEPRYEKKRRRKSFLGELLHFD